MTNYAFYDFETTGISPAFDQPLQFAAILTDENFNPLEEVNIRCRLSDHILPSPIAVAVTGVMPNDMLSPNMSWYDFSRELTALITRWKPAIWTGYNSLSFDENVFRQLFYQTLQSNIYITQLDGNLRLDILKAVYASWAYGNTGLSIPTNDQGKLTSKLDMLAPYNGFTDHHAHDALGDVKATIHVAKIIRDTAPAIWSAISSNLNKGQLTAQLHQGTVYELVERFGAAPPRIYRGCYCGTSASNKNQFGFFDFNQANAADFLSGDADLFAGAVSKSPKIIRTLDLNKMPLLVPASNVTADELTQTQLIQNSKAILTATGQALAGRYADRETPELVEQQIYEGFYSHADKQRIAAFHQAAWSDRYGIVQSFDDVRLRELGMRLLVLFANDTVSNAESQNFWDMIAARWSGDVFYGDNERNPGNTYESVAEDLKQLDAGGKFEQSADDLKVIREFFNIRKM